MIRVFIDGSAGTTGLQIRERLAARRDVELMLLPEDLRKDTAARRECLNGADAAFLCLPDAAAREAVELVEDPKVCVIDTSTAHRTDPAWQYGFPELGFAEKIAASKRIANPGCHATGFISIVCPLVRCGLIPQAAALSCFSLTGYSGGGKKMIADYEGPEKGEARTAPGIYALSQAHKHLPEMQKICGLRTPPVFSPIVDDYFKGMAVTVPLNAVLCGGAGPEEVRSALSHFYTGSPIVRVRTEEECGSIATLYANALAGSDRLDLVVAGGREAFTVTALFDNLGKGASGAAIENMNLAMGLPPETGLVL